MGATTGFCAQLAALAGGDLDAPVLARARQLVLDGIAIAVAGTAERAIQILADFHREQFGHREQSGHPEQSGHEQSAHEQSGRGQGAGATVLGMGFRLPPVSAAAVNGAAMHVLDFEPMWSPANHALSTTLPAVLALAEHRGASGLDVLTAVVKGCEAQGWLREASGQYEPRALVFHPPGVVGPIGSAVAAGHLLGLDAGRLAHAVGIAASRAGALLANVGTMTKSLHCGVAAAAGLEAALLAARGFTANTDVLEARQGLAAAFFGEGFRPEQLLRAGPPFRLMAPGYALKMFPSQYGTHFAITAALALHGGIGPADGIRRVRLVAPVMPYIDRPRPPTGLDGKFSLQYTTAAALLDGGVGIGTFTDGRLGRADMQALLPRIELVMSPDIPARFEGMHVALELWLQDGRHLAARCDAPPGSWTGAPVSAAAHLAKVRDCLAVRLPPQRVGQVMDGVARLETLTPDGVRALVALAAAPSH